MTPLTIVTWNTHHGEGVDGELDLERVARTLVATGADVVALQEVDVAYGERSDWVDQAAWYETRLGMHLAFGANIEREVDIEREPNTERPTKTGRTRRYGTAILSRYPILRHRNMPLPRLWPKLEPRGLLHAEIAVANHTIGIFNTHLQSHHSPTVVAKLERRLQARRVHATLAGYAHPFLLTGDFNAKPDGPELRELRRDYTDAWEATGDGPGLTRLPDTQGGLGRRIDYVFASPSLSVTRAELVESDASDHMPLVVEVAID